VGVQPSRVSVSAINVVFARGLLSKRTTRLITSVYGKSVEIVRGHDVV